MSSCGYIQIALNELITAFQVIPLYEWNFRTRGPWIWDFLLKKSDIFGYNADFFATGERDFYIPNLP